MQATCFSFVPVNTVSASRSAHIGALAMTTQRPARLAVIGKPALRAALYEFCFGNWAAGDATVDSRLLFDVPETDLERFGRDLGYHG